MRERETGNERERGGERGVLVFAFVSEPKSKNYYIKILTIVLLHD